VSWYQKGNTNLDLLEQEIVSGSGISWAYANLHLAQTDNHASIPSLGFLQAGCPSCYPNQQFQSTEGTTNSVKSLKAHTDAFKSTSDSSLCTTLRALQITLID